MGAGGNLNNDTGGLVTWTEKDDVVYEGRFNILRAIVALSALIHELCQLRYSRTSRHATMDFEVTGGSTKRIASRQSRRASPQCRSAIRMSRGATVDRDKLTGRCFQVRGSQRV